MFNIIKFPDPFLSKKLPEFDFANPIMDPELIEKEMLKTMYAAKGIGLSANQVGLNARVFVMGHTDNPDAGKAFFNPMIIETVDTLDTWEEGCLSFDGIFVSIKRPKKILARWQNTKGAWEQSEFDGYHCICFLHELDHLEGITFKDRTSTLRWALAVKKSNKERRLHGRTK
jgi:peptide deformylase